MAGSATLGSLKVLLSADSAQITADLGKARTAAKNWSREMGVTVNDVDRAWGGMTSTIGSVGPALKGAQQASAAAAQALKLVGNEGSTAVTGLSNALSGLLAGGFTPLALAVAGITAAVGYFTGAQERAAKATEETSKKAKEQAEALERLAEKAQAARDKLTSTTTGTDGDLLLIDRKIAAAEQAVRRLATGHVTDDMVEEAKKAGITSREVLAQRYAAATAETLNLQKQRDVIVERIELEKQLAAEQRRRAAVEELIRNNEKLSLEQTKLLPRELTTPGADRADAERKVRALEALLRDQRELIEMEALRAQAAKAEAADQAAHAAAQKKANDDLTKSIVERADAEAAAAQAASEGFDERMRQYMAEAEAEERRRRAAAASEEWATFHGANRPAEPVVAASQKLEDAAATPSAEDTVSSRFTASMESMADTSKVGSAAAEGLAGTFDRAFQSIVTGSENAGDAFRTFVSSMLLDLGKAITEAMIFKAVLSALGLSAGAAAGAGGGGAVAAAGGGAPAGAHGGTWRVGGFGGLDTKLVSLRLSPGELVKVTGGANSRGEGGGGFHGTLVVRPPAVLADEVMARSSRLAKAEVVASATTRPGRRGMRPRG